MKIFNKILFVIAVGAMALVGCSKSTELSSSDYQYSLVNSLTIKTDTSNFEVFQFDSLYIKPTIVESKPAGSTFEYEWKALGTDKTTVLSTDQDLSVSVGLAPGTYNIQYTITDKSNGLQFNKLFDLKVNSSFSSGWYVTHNKNNKAGLSFIRNDGTVFYAPAEEANDKVFPGRALSAYSTNISNVANSASTLYFTTEGVFRFDPNSFVQVGDTQTVLPHVTGFTNPNYTISGLKADQYIIDSGSLYAGFGLFYPAEILTPFSPRFEGDYELFNKALIAATLTTYFYDNKYKRFMSVLYRERKILVAAATPNDSFDMSNVGKTMIAADYGGKGTAMNTTKIYCVMEDDEGRYLMSFEGGTPKLYNKVEDAASPDFSRATLFTSTGTSIEQMYYAYQNKIYLYDIPNNTAALIYQFPTGHNITSLEVDKSTENLGKTLAVATAYTNEGEVYLFNINTLGWFTNNTFASSYKGFGEVVHLSKK